MNEFWRSLGRGARVSLLTGTLVVLAACAALGYWALRTDYEVLFSNLSVPDAAAMTGELERMKQPYKIGPDGASILVDRTVVHQVRMKLMGKDLPLHGAVGFELFNNTDFGMTEFAQKVNYQRALQGEITRTILSLEEVESVRVHLTLPEEGLFKSDRNRSKASITLGLRRGQSLRREQVHGIQRLVAAAVPGITAHDVTLTDVRGVALTQGTTDASAVADAGALDTKRDIERHLARKATEVLERAFGVGTVLVSVDVVLDMNQVRVTKEEVLGTTVKGDAPATGILVKERESVKEGVAKESGASAGGSSSREAEYQVGRRVEQVVSQPGAVQRIQVAVVLKAVLDAAREEQARLLVAAAVGATKERGDLVVLQTFPSTTGEPASTSWARSLAEPAPTERAEARGMAKTTAAASDAAVGWLAALALAVSAGVVAWLLLKRRNASAQPGSPMNDVDRAAALARIQEWLAPSASAPETGGAP